jgi:GDP-4-dehydro-6-deoxy-D-mannose reductase
MKKVLITGASGFVGTHLARRLLAGEYDVYGTVFGHGNDLAELIPKEQIVELNLLDRETTGSIIQTIKPDWVFHLAALSSVGASFDDPRKTLTNNIEGQINLMDAIRLQEVDCRVLIIGSAEEYGKVSPEENPIDESAPLRPMNPYAVSKIAQDFLGLQYNLSFGMDIVRVRPFNHTGPGQTDQFVIPAFAKQIANIEAGKQEPVIKVGNLEAVRDFTHVEDMVDAYVLLMQQGKSGDVYNIGSGNGHQIAEVLDGLLALSTKTITIEKDPQRMRPSDVPKLVADNTKFNSLTGWTPTHSLNDILSGVLDYWRGMIVNQ